MSQPLVTAIIGTYNQGAFVEEAVESVLAQTFPSAEREIVVVDDGSTDDTSVRLRRFGDAIRLFSKPNGGQASTLNLGFGVARGQILIPLDGDDVWAPSKIEKVVEAFETHASAGMVYHGRTLIAEDGTVIGEDSLKEIDGFVPEDPRNLLRYGGVPTSVTAFRRESLSRLLPIPATLRILADGYLIYLIVFLSEIVFVRDFLTRYRLHRNNLFSISVADDQRLARKLECEIALHNEVERWFRENGYGVSDPVLSAYVRRLQRAADATRFALEGTTRWEFFRHLREESLLYGRSWTSRYQAWRLLTALGALAVGYDVFERLRSGYGRSGALQSCRDALFPVHRLSRAAANGRTR